MANSKSSPSETRISSSRRQVSIERTDSEVANEDLRDLMELLGMSLHARPESPHEVFQNEVMPRVEKCVKALQEVSDGAVYATNGDDTYTVSGTVVAIVREALGVR